jgi:hypothetical protein
VWLRILRSLVAHGEGVRPSKTFRRPAQRCTWAAVQGESGVMKHVPAQAETIAGLAARCERSDQSTGSGTSRN